MPSDVPPSRSTLEAFLEQYLADRRAGAARPIREYLDRFPGDDEALVHEYVRLQARAAPPEEERVGPYRIAGELGRGGQGVVYLATDTRNDRSVALKVLNGIGAASEGVLARFRREAEVASRLAHPGICTVFESGIERGVALIAMRYARGETLAKTIPPARWAPAPDLATALHFPAEAPDPRAEAESPGPHSPATDWEIPPILLLIEKTANALHAAHDAGIIHRDIKPGNIIVTPAGEPVL